MSRAVELRPGLWEVTGKPQGFPIPRNMHLFRLPGDGLLVTGAMTLPDFGWDEIEELGTPELVMVTSPFHNANEAEFPGRHAFCKLIAPAATEEAIRKVLPVSERAEDVLPELGIGVLSPAGLRPLEVALDLPVEDGRALVFGDMLFNLPHLPGLGGLITRLIGSSGFLGITRIGRAILLESAPAFQAWLRERAETEDLALLCFGHGTAVDGQQAARDGLLAAAARLG
ncbi:MAG: hypothetical protein FJZ01_20355 [Candidatus Sericytochromatia bacterium]|nr:hypothetical protein [Candidatus Tanganyikabacteria bacterium]